MNVLVIGGGGREHTLVWKISQNPDVKKIYCIPGNGGIEQVAECYQIDLNDFKRIEAFVKEKGIDFTIVGPEQSLVNGIVDYFETQNMKIFGPNQKAAQMEGSKIFAKKLMHKYDIPTAEFEVFESYSLALKYLKDLPNGPIVVKADGLAAGKGAVVCESKGLAEKTLEDMMSKKVFKDAGNRIVIEECMQGEEASLFVVTDGKDYVTLTPAQDYKRAKDNDEGKNTGGMGSYAPTPFFTKEFYNDTIQKIVEPTLSALQSEGINYNGVLYCGLMLTGSGPKVVEFNCRFGDPETQVVLPLLKTDLIEIIAAVQNQSLGNFKVVNYNQNAVCVVLASGGYPDKYETGKEIKGLNLDSNDIQIFHAGTKREGDKFLTSGGRVLGITGIANDLKTAAGKAYQLAERIHFEKKHFRKDIAKKAFQ
jgi:phosphoribosylamine--glycine ligase